MHGGRWPGVITESRWAANLESMEAGEGLQWGKNLRMIFLSQVEKGDSSPGGRRE